jgi:hypothetical protein
VPLYAANFGNTHSGRVNAMPLAGLSLTNLVAMIRSGALPNST